MIGFSPDSPVAFERSAGERHCNIFIYINIYSCALQRKNLLYVLWIPFWYQLLPLPLKETIAMHVISVREFRENQTATLLRALQGESVLLTSRLGAFKLTPVTAEEKIVSRISLGLNEVKLIEAGKLPAKDAKSFLDEL